MSTEEALAADREGRVVEAASLYEQAIATSAPALFLLMNLAVLYWQATEYGFAVSHGLSREFMAQASARYHELLDKAANLYPENHEPIFWRKYIGWSDFGKPFPVDECRMLLPADRSVHVASMYLFALSRGTECAEEALRLLEASRHDGTTRAKYVISVIESTLKRRAGNRKG